MKKWNLMALLLCLVLPMSAFAVTDGVVEDAPMVEVQTGAQDISYLPDASYYADDTSTPAWENAETWFENRQQADGDGFTNYLDAVQTPRLTAGEAARAQKLLEDFQAGTIVYTGEPVLEKMEDVIVGVYALNAAEFDGEEVFVILPSTCLTDDQLLSIIAAYDELGLTFNPAGLNYRNCARGGGIETNRFFTTEEMERYSYMAGLIRRGLLTIPEGSNTDGVLRNLKLADEYFFGLRSFPIKPYRSMTDEELISLLVAIGVHDESDELNYDEVESRARTAFYDKFRCPMSMELIGIFSEGMYVPTLFTADANKDYDYDNAQLAFGAFFSYIDQENIKVEAQALFDKNSGELISLSTSHYSPTPYYEEAGSSPTGITESVTQEKIDETIAGVEAKLNLSGLEWHVEWEHKTFNNWGPCLPVRALVGENSILTVLIGGDDGCEHGLELVYGTLVEELPTIE